MKNRQKNIDDLFKEELGNYTETPPPPAWDALEKRLKSAPAPGFSFYRYRHVGLIALLLLLGVPMVFKITGSSNGNNNTSNNTLTNNSPAANSGNNNNITNGNNNNQQSAQGNPSADPGAATVNKPDYKNLPNKQNNTTQKQSQSIAKSKNSKNGKHVATNKNTSKLLSYSGNDNNQANEPYEQNVYNSHSENETPSVANNDSQPETNPVKDKETQKANDNKPGKPNGNNQDKQDQNKKKDKPKFTRFELGVKGGYETGFDNDAAKKLVISPYVQYKVSPKLAIMLQPSIKAARLNTRMVGTPATYYKENADSSITAVRDPHDVNLLDGTKMAMWHFSYSQSHDSIVKSYSFGGNYMEFEIPVLLKYYISNSFSVYGGVNISYSQLISINERTVSRNNILKIDTSRIQLAPAANVDAPTAQYHVNDLIKYSGNNGTPYANYTGPIYSSPDGSLLKFGYMVGFSYEANKRVLFDLLVQQASAKSYQQAGYNVNSTLSAPYIRFTLGYKLIK